MTKVTSKEIANFRTQLADDEIALEALDLIEDCEGDLEDAAMTLAIKAGQQPESANSIWLDALARQWRTIICEPQFREEMEKDSIRGMMAYLKSTRDFPPTLATPVLLYVLKQGVNDFCSSLDSIK
jgi:hypothetical protein